MREVKNKPTIYGHLAANSPLLSIFADGTVPIVSPVPERAELGEPPHTITAYVYLLQTDALTDEQKRKCAEIMSQGRADYVHEILETMNRCGEVPIRTQHFAATTAPLRLFV